MNKENQFEKLEKQLFEHFDNDNIEIPLSTKYTIENALKRKKEYKTRNNIYKVAIYFISFIVLTTSVVFAKDIINFVSSLFVYSTDGINEAVKNGYVQNVDMNYIYKQGIGIKVDYLVMDESNLNVSFVYDCSDSNISSIKINEYIIRDKYNNIICFKLDNNEKINSEKIPLFNCITNNSENFKESILCMMNNMPKTDSLIFEIQSLALNYKDNSNPQYIKSNYIFSIDLNNRIVSRTTNEYVASYSKYIENISAILSETSLQIKINLNEQVNVDYLMNRNNIILKNNMNEEYKCLYHEYYDNYIQLEYDISKYYINIDELNLRIKFDTNKDIDIKLNK